MVGGMFTTVSGAAAGAAVLGLSVFAFSFPYLPDITASLFPFVADFPIPDYALAIPFFTKPKPEAASSFDCDLTHTYKTELVSLDPLVIYIHSLLTPPEISALLATAEPRFAPSEVVKYGRDLRTTDRTSSSAGLPRDDPAVTCVMARARSFLGSMMRDGWDDMGPAQLVRYRAGQRFNIHHDWYETPRWSNDRSDTRTWNRVASFFVILQDNCTGGETHFPYIRGVTPASPRGEPAWSGDVVGMGDGSGGKARPLWREHEDGGLAFRPVAGNAVFWVNLHANGTGDERVMHAGLPVGEGLKTAMNIWPRRYYAND